MSTPAPMSVLVEIYSKDHCPYCTKAKVLLDTLGAIYTEHNVSKDPAKRDEMLARRPSARTFPQIFIGGQGIGGCDDLYALHESGRLENILDI